MEENAGGYCDIDRLNRGGEGDRHQTADPLTHVRRQTGALVSNHDCKPGWNRPLRQYPALCIRAPELDAVPAEERKQAFGGIMKGGVMKEGTHRAADNFRVPDVDSSGQCNGRIERKCRGGTKNRADVAGILKSVENQQAETIFRHEAFEIASRNFGHRENPLRGLGFSGGTELRVVHWGCGNTLFCQQLKELSPARSAGELGSGQNPDSSEGRGKQLLDRANAFRHKKGLALPGFPAPKVAGEGQQSQGEAWLGGME